MTLKTNTGGSRSSQMSDAFTEEQRRAGQQASTSQSQQSAEEGSSPFTIRQLSSIIDLPAAASTQSEVLAKARGVLEAEIKSVPDPTFDVTFVGMDRENPSLNLGVSVLVACVQIRNGKNFGIGYHAMLLEASSPEPAPAVITLGQGRTVELKRTTGDAYDDIMRDEIRKELMRLYPNMPLHNGEARVVPDDFKYDDTGMVKRLRSEVVTAAAVALLSKMPKFMDLNVATLKPDNTLSLHTSFNNPQVTNSVGQPIRADIRIQFKAGAPTRTQQGSQSQNLEKVSEVTSVYGYIDLVHQMNRTANPFLPVQQQQQFVPGQPSPYQQYLARFVITQLRSSQAATLGQQLLSLVTVYTLRKPGAWYPTFKPQYHLGREKSIDLHDIGVIGLETMTDPATGLGVKINTKVDTFKPTDLGSLLNATVRPGLVVSLDIPECGDDTWRNAMFADAAAGDARANTTLYDAANFLTGGELEKIFPRSAQICFNENNRIQLGQYTGQAGEKSDARDLDYVAMMNLMGERDIKVVRDWTATYLRNEFPIEQRLDARLQIAQSLMPDLKVTGYASRVTFTDKFLEALTMAVGATGLSVREVSPFNDTAGFDVPSYQFADVALGGYQATPLFTHGGMGAGTMSQGGRSGRWS